MNRERWARIERIVHEALDVPAEARPAFVLRETAGDAGLRREVASLLRELEEDPGFLETPVGRVAEAAAWVPDGSEDTSMGPYRLVRPLGRGGMGQVYLAVRDEPRQHVAIKRIRRGLDTDEILARFRNERRILAALSHPNIARLFDVGADEAGRPYFVMEYVDGVPVDDYCDERRLGVGRRLALFLQVCSAVQHAHQNLVVHRDLKPGNILVTSDGVPKLLDFGIGKVLIGHEDREVTRAEARFFTPEYAAPEILRDEAVTTATDVYQLGLLLYRLLCGRGPHPGGDRTRDEWRRTVLETTPERPSAALARAAGPAGTAARDEPLPEEVARARATDVEGLRRRLKGDLDTIVLKAIRVEPTERYASAAALADDLRRHLEGRPVSARPDTLAYRTGKFLVRNRVAVAVAAIVFGSLTLTTAVTLRQSARVRAESERVARERDKAIQVKGFLLEALGNTGPDLPTGDSVTARQLLDLRAATLDQEFGDRPELKAEFLDVLAEGYDKLSLFDPAEEHAREALSIRRELFADDEAHADVATSLNTLGWVLHQKGSTEEAEPLVREAVAMRRFLFPRGHELLARSLNDLGVIREARGDYGEAERLYRESLDMRVGLVGERHRGVAVTLSNLSVVLYRQGRLDDAVAMARRALDTFRAVLGDDHQRSLIVQSNLAAFLQASGEVEGAIELNRDALERRQRLLGPDHFQVGLSMGLLADALQQAGDLDEATAMLRGQVRIYRRWFSDPSTYVAGALNNLALVLLERGLAHEAHPPLREALAIRRDRLGLRDGYTATYLGNLANAALAIGDTVGAVTARREAVAIFEAVLGDDHETTMAEALSLALTLRAQGETVEADSLAARVIAALGDREGTPSIRRMLEDIGAERRGEGGA